MKAQRLRFRHRVTAAAAGGMGSRNLVRAWEAAISDAGYRLSYSEGRRRSPQIAVASPLPLGTTSDCELIDIYLEEAADAAAVFSAVSAHLPEGIEPLEVTEIGVDGPSLQSQLRCAEYEAMLPPGTIAADDLKRRVDDLLAASTFPTEYVRGDKVKTYDLRPLIIGIYVEDSPEAPLIHLRLRAEQDRTARADQVLLALGVETPAHIHRSSLEVDAVPAVLLAYRRVREPTGSDLQ